MRETGTTGTPPHMAITRVQGNDLIRDLRLTLSEIDVASAVQLPEG